MSQYGDYFSDPDEMEKYKEKIRLRKEFDPILPDANTYENDYFRCVKVFLNSPNKYFTFKRINVNGSNGIFKQWEADI